MIKLNSNYFDLSSKHVFLTGGGSGIGAFLTQGFLAQKAKVSFVQRSNADEFVEEMRSTYSADCMAIKCDISDIDALKNAMHQAQDAFGNIEVLVNNAGNDVRHKIEDFDAEKWDANIAINLRPYYFTSQFVAPTMRIAGSGSIINISSISYMLGLSGYPAYALSNAGITGLTRALARELGSSNIKVNALAPGWVLTDKQIKLWANPAALKEHLAKQCIPETIKPEDIVEPVLFMASKASRMMTGQCMVIDGGTTFTG